ncbi:hypothetical protein TanjilG_02622 [Lupinus angustifolius]|uniref:Uncharacterized protein n=1 Tax=Lupinus angustifolius TaxID=3871 RepID=A0A4P1R932_LUPAN|nr:hypothetical protein TanjilG_02622 [Lupinus angustifolius]
MKFIALFLTIIVVTSHLVESRAIGLGGIYGQEQRNHVGNKGKVIESKLKTNNPTSVANENHHAKSEVGNGTSQKDDEDRNKDGKFKRIVGHA